MENLRQQINILGWPQCLIKGEVLVAGEASSRTRTFLQQGTVCSSRFFQAYTFHKNDKAFTSFSSNEALLYTWRLGMHSLQVKGGTVFRTRKYELHPKFRSDKYYDDYDMAIVTVDRKINFNNNILPICLQTAPEMHFGEKATVAGW